ncbi:ribosomal-processing cysteine protease Prp [Brevibacillus daliensis]|uniref:ribosomal-processing cysteine protease Prp n=1 Tax=Brevibacillus daliensis TaxID=2892995 RepID=UPI001E437FF6|nr:ribosomal-processing cysteine protease Prp [Brevibacillus daliensis]
MVTVDIKRTDTGIAELTIAGHANAGKHGQDIVCASVSAVSIGTLNAVHQLLGIRPDVEMAEKGGGFIRWTLHPHENADLEGKQQLLAESVVVTLVAISQQYEKYITVNDPKWQGGALS